MLNGKPLATARGKLPALTARLSTETTIMAKPLTITFVGVTGVPVCTGS